MKKPTNFTLSLVDPIAASLVLKHERNFPANARDEILARTEDNHDFDFIADPRDLVDRIFRRNGRVGTYYGESWDEILAYNAVQVAAGTPSNCVAFEDSAGTIPLVAPLGSGKGCGLLKDRSGGGNHRIQTSATARGEMSRRVNLLTKTEQFEDVVWIPTNITPTLGQSGISGVAPVAMRLAPTTTSGIHGFKSVNVAGRGVTTHSVYLKADGYSKVGFKESGTSGSFAAFDLSSATVLSSTPTSLPTIQSLDGGWCRISFSPVTVNAAQAFDIRVLSPAYTSGDTNASTFAGDGVSGVLMCGPQMEDGQKDLPYQRVTTATDYDEEGFPAFLRRQTDDWSKAHINPNGATKVFVLTAIQKMSDANAACLLESGINYTTVAGTFAISGPNNSNSAESSFAVGGTAKAVASLTSASPQRLVLGAYGDINSPIASVRRNLEGVVGSSTASQGTGTLTEQDIYFGARAGTGLFVNDREYSPPLILFMQPGDPGISAAAIRNLTKLFSKGIGL